MDINLDDLSLKELKDLRARTERAISTYEDRKKKLALAELEDTARRLGFSLADLTGITPPRKRSASAPRYANPENPAETWTGRGRKPQWARAALDSGKSLEDLAI